MRKLSVVLPLLLVLAAGCDATRRDFGVCDQTYACDLHAGLTCDFTTGTCVPIVPDSGAVDSQIGETGNPPDLSSGEANELDAKDAPAAIDGAPVALDTAPVDIVPVDATIVDAPQVVDVAGPDLRVPDAAGSCSVNSDCIGVVGGNYCLNSRCVACTTSDQCNNDAGVPFCSAQNTCVSCVGMSGSDGGSACPGTTLCDSKSGRCVECVNNRDCPQGGGKAFCVQNQCVGCDHLGASAGPIDGGVSDGGLPDGGATSACTGTKPVCATSGTAIGQCVQCVSNANCSGATPICNTTTNTCAPCTSDSQCTTGPGICMFQQSGIFPQDGRCASDAETIYVQNVTNCGTGAGAGTAALPFCQPQEGINAVTTTRRVVAITGPAALGVWSASLTSSQPIYVIGRKNLDSPDIPIVSPGAADIGIHVMSGNVYIRGLKVQGVGSGDPAPTQPAIVVESGATIGLDRCIVMGSAGGLAVNDGAGFDIANCVFAQNQPGSVGAAVFGGVYLGSVGTTGLSHRFWFNTIADNQQIGIACTSKSQSLDGCLLTTGNIGGQVVNCTLAATTKSPSTGPTGTSGIGFSTDISPPIFDPNKPYHLSSGSSKSTTSPCKDFITDLSVPHPADDMDGQSRPNGVGIDCGADEYWP